MLQEVFGLAQRDTGRAFHGKTVSARADGGKGHRLYAVRLDQGEATLITTGEQFFFSLAAIAPDRADGVNDPAGRKFIGTGNFGPASGAAAKGAAFRQELRA